MKKKLLKIAIISFVLCVVFAATSFTIFFTIAELISPWPWFTWSGEEGIGIQILGSLIEWIVRLSGVMVPLSLTGIGLVWIYEKKKTPLVWGGVWLLGLVILYYIGDIIRVWFVWGDWRLDYRVLVVWIAITICMLFITGHALTLPDTPWRKRYFPFAILCALIMSLFIALGGL